MSTAIRLQLETGQLLAWQYRRGRLEACGSFPETADGIRDFSRFLAVDRQRHYLMLVNRDEESYLTEKPPPLGRAEMQQLLSARSRRLFPDTPWRCVESAPGANGETPSASLMALHHTAGLRHWLDPLDQTSAIIDGLYSLPQLLPALLSGKRREKDSALVISQHHEATRLTLLDGRRIVASRLYRAPTGPIDEAFCRNFLALSAHHALASALPPCYLLGSARWINAQALRETATHLPGPTDSALAILVLPWRRWPKTQFSAAAARQARQRYWLRLGSSTAAALLIALTGSQWLAARTARQAIDLEQQRQAALTATPTSQPQTAPQPSLPPEQLAQASTEAHALNERRESFSEALASLSRALEATPDVHLQAIEWHAGETIMATPTLTISARTDGITDAAEHGLRRRLDELGLPTTAPRPTEGSPGEFSLHLAVAKQR